MLLRLFKFLKPKDRKKDDDITNFLGYDKAVLAILFMVLALLKQLNLVNISETAILSYSISGLFFAVSSTLPYLREQRIFYFLGLFCIIVLPYGKEVLFTIFFKDSSFYTLWGVAFVFIALSKSEYDSYFHNKKEKQLESAINGIEVLNDSYINLLQKETNRNKAISDLLESNEFSEEQLETVIYALNRLKGGSVEP